MKVFLQSTIIVGGVMGETTLSKYLRLVVEGVMMKDRGRKSLRR